MAWYWILLIVLASLVGVYLLGFLFFIMNGDGKMIEHIYNLLTKFHDKKKKHDKI